MFANGMNDVQRLKKHSAILTWLNLALVALLMFFIINIAFVTGFFSTKKQVTEAATSSQPVVAESPARQPSLESPLIQAQQPAAAPVVDYAMAGEWDGEMSPAILALDKLYAFTEGDADGVPADTVYIMFDPRCPYCHKAYANVRPWVKSGRRVKWIPVSILGDIEQGKKIIAAMDRDPALFDKVMTGKADLAQLANTEVPPELAQKIQDSFVFMMAAFKNSNYERAGVPVFYWFDRRDGVAEMRLDVSQEGLMGIWGDYK